MGVPEYFKETQGEMKKVSWPTRRQVTVSTFAIVVVSILVALLLGVFDFIFSSTLGKILVNEGAGQGTTTLPLPLNTLPASGNPVNDALGTGPTDPNAILPTLPNTGTGGF